MSDGNVSRDGRVRGGALRGASHVAGRGLPPMVVGGIAAVVLLAFGGSASVSGQPAVPPPGDAPPISADEAIRVAVDALEQLDAAKDADTRRAAAAKAAEMFPHIREGAPGSPWLKYIAARVLLASGRKRDAIDALQDFVGTGVGRTYWQAYRILGDLFVDGFPRQARSYYDKADALASDEPPVLYGLSRCATQLGEKQTAVTLARRAVEADGRRSIQYLSHLTTTLARAGQLDDALREAVAALDRAEVVRRADPASREPVQAADTLYGLAIEIVRGRIARAPAESEDYVRLSRFMQQREAVRLTLALIDALSAIDAGLGQAGEPAPIPLLQERAQLLAKLGRLDDAIDTVKRILDARPDDATAKSWLDKLTTARGSAADESSP